MRPNTQVSILKFCLAAGVYLLLVIVSNEFLKGISDVPWRFLIAILPLLPVIYVLHWFLRYLRDLDELLQRIQLHALGFAAGATGMITLTYGFLENAGLPRLSIMWTFPLLCFLWSGATIVLTRRYQ